MGKSEETNLVGLHQDHGEDHGAHGESDTQTQEYRRRAKMRPRRITTDMQIEHRPIAMVDGNVVYEMTERSLAHCALQDTFAEQRPRERSRSRQRLRTQRSNPELVASSSTSSDTMVTSRAWPRYPPLAQTGHGP